MKLEINKRTEAILTEIRDYWFPKEQEPMKLEEFIYTLACSVIYNTVRITKQDGGFAVKTKKGKVLVEIPK
jgi:hypothetical protein